MHFNCNTLVISLLLGKAYYLVLICKEDVAKQPNVLIVIMSTWFVSLKKKKTQTQVNRNRHPLARSVRGSFIPSIGSCRQYCMVGNQYSLFLLIATITKESQNSLVDTNKQNIQHTRATIRFVYKGQNKTRCSNFTV